MEEEQMSILSGLGNIAKTIGKGAAAGAKFAAKHAEEIATVTNVAVQTTEAVSGIYNQMSDVKGENNHFRNDQEYYAQLESINNFVHSSIDEINSTITQVEQQYSDTYVEFSEFKCKMTDAVTALQVRFDNYVDENAAYQKKCRRMLIVNNVLVSAGVIAAIIIAIFL
jgi:antitoxin component HigA of HigAB toxin-antitoxin module